MSRTLVMQHAFPAGIADYRAIWTWRSWMLGWMVRVLAVIPLTGVVAIASYCFGTFLAGLVFRFREINSLVVLVGYVGLMTVCGVNVPLSYYPTALEWTSRFLPLTNGLLAIRGVFEGAQWSTILGDVALEGAVAVGWMTAALLSFKRLASRGRLDGSLDYGA